MSVKALVEFLYQSGDLSASFLSAERANLGARIHRKLQAQAPQSYKSEVFLKDETMIENDMRFIIEGRADGILVEEDAVLIDEIKTISCEYEKITEDLCFTHWAQAYTYGYIYAKQNTIASLTIQLTYYQIDIDEIKRFQRKKSFAELETFYLDMLSQYRAWALLQRNFVTVRDHSIKELDFPFPTYRKGQRELAVAVYRTILEEDVMFAQAPTGIGKTMSTLFPSIKALREKKAERIFYLCAKTITASVAQESIKKMMDKGLHIKSTTLTAKDKMCLLEERNCDPAICPYAAGYYDRLRPALFHLLEHHDVMDKELFTQYGKEYTLCPFEFSLDATLYSDIIICDYNYVFDPHVYLKRFFSDSGEYLFLIDEAHNMVDRARAMYSAVLTRSSFVNLRKLIPTSEKELRKILLSIAKEMKALSMECEDGFFVSKEPFISLQALLNKFQKECNLFLQKEHEQSDAAKDVYFEVVSFLRIAEYYDDHFVTYVQEELQDVMIKQCCLNPARPITDMLHKGKAAVFFSATLTPIRYFTTLLLDQECEKKIALPSPFDPQRNKLLINNVIDTRYRVRAQSIQPICDMIATTVQAKKGNYIVFFPSYTYLREVVTVFIDQNPTIHVEIQASSMNEDERRDFLHMFESNEETMVCFCVLGGMFSEGIDLKGDRLIGVIIVGVGLPQINEETNLIRDFFQDELGLGYEYAYVYPGMNKVLQAAGRVIRSMEDCGVILLIDERYTSATYRPLFPAHMRHYEIVQKHSQLQTILTAFWRYMKR